MKEIIRQKIETAIRELSFGEAPVFDVSRVKDEQFGDYATNVAMVLAKPLGKSPMVVAEVIKEQITGNREQGTGSVFEKIKVAKPGYINFSLSPAYLESVLGELVENGPHFGDSETGKEKKVNNEFISANPTGPLHLGNARGGFYGDALSRVLRKTGAGVTNEYYVNDAGEQVVKLGHSVLKDEEAVYSGEYIDELNSQFAIRNSQFDPREVGEKAADIVLEEMIKPTAAGKMGIVFDSWISEKKDIVEAGLVDRAINILKEKGLTFENEGALWLRTSRFGDDKDRVLVKSDGTRTYFASDCGYILHKMERGFTVLLELWGADHHGYIARFEAAARALGFTGDIRFFIMQLVRLMKDGQEVRMSKRAGNVVTVDELLEKIPVDVARFFFLMYSPDTHMNFDLGLAEERSAKNPVYYVQYAYARLSSILRKAKDAGIPEEGADLTILSHPKERELLREMAFFPELVEEVASTYAVHKLPQYAIRIADKLHSFYDECLVIDTKDAETTKARLALVSGVRTILGEALRLMGVTAPERMGTQEGKTQETKNK